MTNRDWLEGYSNGLIRRQELFVLANEKEWLGLGECRISETQFGIADLGVMVAPTHRNQGRATEILKRLVHYCQNQSLQPICSTTIGNMSAQKAIIRSGFSTQHRILDFKF